MNDLSRAGSKEQVAVALNEAVRTALKPAFQRDVVAQDCLIMLSDNDITHQLRSARLKLPILEELRDAVQGPHPAPRLIAAIRLLALILIDLSRLPEAQVARLIRNLKSRGRSQKKPLIRSLPERDMQLISKLIEWLADRSVGCLGCWLGWLAG